MGGVGATNSLGLPQPLYCMLRNSVSGLEIGVPSRILAGLPPGKDRNRLSGRPKAGPRADFGAFPVAVRRKSGPEIRFPGRTHYPVGAPLFAFRQNPPSVFSGSGGRC